MPVSAQYTHDGTGAGGGFPDAFGQSLDAQERFNRNGRRFVQIRAALGVGVALYLATMIKHGLVI
jgi:hypothetical protein